MSIAAKNGKVQKSGSLPLGMIANDLQIVEEILTDKFAPYRCSFPQILDHLEHYRGKRLRPTLLLLTAHACGKVVSHHHVLAAVVEMIHTATLVHDDVLDEADVRRHVSTVNAKWGNKVSILLGDLLFTNAFHLASSVDARACEWIGEATNRVCAGELKQLCERGNLQPVESTYWEIIDGKTGALTECCTRLGAVYAGASSQVVDAMADFGRHLGLAFQIADDVLDLTGTEQTCGKTLGTDLEQKTFTLPMIRMFDQLSTGDATRVRSLLQDPSMNHEAIRQYLQKTDAIEYARNQAEMRIEKAKRCLQVLPLSMHRDVLRLIAEWSIAREK